MDVRTGRYNEVGVMHGPEGSGRIRVDPNGGAEVVLQSSVALTGTYVAGTKLAIRLI